MFYESETIDKKFLCPSCNLRFNVPKILPCGETICETCVEKCVSKSKSLLGVNSNSYYNTEMISAVNITSIECPLCNDVHEIPKNGFPTQKLLMELLNLEPKKVFRGVLFEKFDKTLNNLNQDINTLNEYMEEADLKIQNHCQFLREDVDIFTESLIDDLHKLRLNLFNEIDSYEKNCAANLNNEKKEVSKLLTESIEKYNKFQVELKKPEIEKTQLKIMIDEVRKLREQLKKAQTDCEMWVQVGRLICFKPSETNLKQSNIGEIKYDGRVCEDMTKPIVIEDDNDSGNEICEAREANVARNHEPNVLDNDDDAVRYLEQRNVMQILRTGQRQTNNNRQNNNNNNRQQNHHHQQINNNNRRQNNRNNNNNHRNNRTAHNDEDLWSDVEDEPVVTNTRVNNNNRTGK